MAGQHPREFEKYGIIATERVQHHSRFLKKKNIFLLFNLEFHPRLHIFLNSYDACYQDILVFHNL
jgi:hypothetical protein